MSFDEKLKYNIVKIVLRHHVPNRDPEGNAHYLLFMFYQLSVMSLS